jgi:predicted nucleic acid-binding protein
VHDLPAADALQLAAALAASEQNPGSLEVVGLDSRLAAAAQREGLRVVGVGWGGLGP